MSRTKNRGNINSCAHQNVTRWKLGKYIRLSKEDLNRGDNDSNSAQNQSRLLDEFQLTYADEFVSDTTYIDDGCTGTSTDRDGFQRLVSDVMNKKINCVIVKDLSRLARNYTDAGGLIENLFVQMNVRFISLGENIDSYKNPDSVSSMLVPITNVFNENYCAQTSRKIRQVMDYKRRQGEFVAPFAPYGYAKAPEDKHVLIVDADAAEVVKQIFSMFVSGTSKFAITHYLNDHGVVCPSVYKTSKGLNYVTPNSSDNPLWSVYTIDGILKNRVYVGDMVQGKRRKKSYKIHIIEKLPEEQWHVVENTHEPIIDRETFAKAQDLLKRDTRTAPKKKELYLFSGFLRCADCGRSMSRIAVQKGQHVYYQCSTYKTFSKAACSMHSIKHHRLEEAVLYAVQQQVYLAVSYSDMVKRINAAPVKKNQSARLNEQIAAKEKELAKFMRYKQSLYQDWKDGEITRDDYRHMSEDYERQITASQSTIANLKEEQAELENGVDAENPFLASFRKYENIDKLTREILIELVDSIKIYEGGDISIKFKFADEYRRVAEYIEINNQDKKAG